ncbi:MAG: hypothetical protein WBG37_03970 [Desulfobacterales bacterium]
MDFRANLLQKIAIDNLAADVINSLKGPDSGLKFDKQSMRRLLELGPYRHQRERDLDLYIQEQGPRSGLILVLDNGLAMYETTLDDVIMRKSPTVKEMVSIRNAIKILNDKDVVRTRKADTVNLVRQVLIGRLDLTYQPADIEALTLSGRGALESQYGPGVEENLGLFAEILDLRPLPKPFRAPHHDILGRSKLPPPPGGFAAAPLVVYNRIENSLKLLEGPLDTRDQGHMERYQQMLEGEVEPDLAGAEVFDWLKGRVLLEKPVLAEAHPPESVPEG